MRRIAVALLVVCAAASSRAQQAANPFPDGPGHDIVATACTQCHNLAPITQLRMGQQGWRKEVENMVLRGAQIRPDELDTVSSYLAASFGPGVPLPAKAGAPVALADGPAHDLVAGECALCHGLDRAVGTARPAGQWNAIVQRMIDLGAPLDQDQAKDVVAYLQANYAARAE